MFRFNFTTELPVIGILIGAMATFACQNVPDIYRNPGYSISRKSSSSSSKGPSASKQPYFVTLGNRDSRRATGRYEQCETAGVRARIIRQTNGTRAVYAYGWDKREAEVFQGKQVEVFGRMTWRHEDLKPAAMNTSRILPLPHFVKVVGINRARYYSDSSFAAFSGDCLK